MAEALSLFYLSLFAASGICIARDLFRAERPLRRIWLGLTFGLLELIWLPALFSFALGFRLLSQLLALAVACVLGVFFYMRSRRNTPLPGSVKNELPIFALIVPLFLLGLYLLSTHTIQPRADGSIWVGQSTYGDLSMHLGFISSIAVQGQFPPMYSICPDKLVGYPFLSSSVGATFCVLGARLRFATMVTAAYAFLLVLMGVYFFFEAWQKKQSKAIFSTLLFFIGGGFGFWYFFDLTKQNPGNFTRAFTAFYETPTNLVGSGMRWVNPIADMMIPQRALLFGWAFLFPCLFLLYRAAMEKKTRMFLPLGVLAAALPLVHTHSFLALGIASGYYFCRSLLRNEDRKQLLGYLKYLGIVLLLAGPQLLIFTFPQSTGSLKLHFNWANEADNYLWFYIKNFGLLALLALPAFFSASKEDRAFCGGMIPIWLIAEFIQFQPNPYDNNKLLFVCFAYTCGLVGGFLVDLFIKLLERRVLNRWAAGFLAALACLSLFASGIITLGREAVSEYQLMTGEEVEAANYIKANAAPEATFLTNNNHNNFVAALTGRNIVCGSGTFLYFHGVNYSAREQALRPMFEQPSLYFETLSKQYDVDYVVVGPYERSCYLVDEAYFAQRYPLFFDNGAVKIYQVN